MNANRIKEAQAYAAADRAIAAADALTFARVGKPQTDASIAAQWAADLEAAEACRRAAKFGPAGYRAQYRAHAEQFEAYTA